MDCSITDQSINYTNALDLKSKYASYRCIWVPSSWGSRWYQSLISPGDVMCVSCTNRPRWVWIFLYPGWTVYHCCKVSRDTIVIFCQHHSNIQQRVVAVGMWPKVYSQISAANFPKFQLTYAIPQLKDWYSLLENQNKRVYVPVICLWLYLSLQHEYSSLLLWYYTFRTTMMMLCIEVNISTKLAEWFLAWWARCLSSLFIHVSYFRRLGGGSD